MSMWYLVEGVLILNCSTPPTLTLIWLAKPWMEGSPVPESHVDCGVPGRLFSHATGLITGEHGLAALATWGAMTNAEEAERIAATPIAASRPMLRHACDLNSLRPSAAGMARRLRTPLLVHRIDPSAEEDLNDR
jgi:hypothetical protein